MRIPRGSAIRMSLQVACGWLIVLSCWSGDARAVLTAEIQKTSTPPVLDGLGSDVVWAGATPHDVTEFFPASGHPAPDDDADLSLTWKALWDDTNLYVFVEVTDDVIINDDSASDPTIIWQDDGVEIYIDAQNTDNTDYRHDKNPTPPGGAPAFQFLALAGDSTGANKFPTHASSPSSPFSTGGNSYVVVDTNNTITQYVQGSDTGTTLITSATTYTLEVAFPWTALEETPANIQANGGFGFGVGVNDDDDEGGRDGQLQWGVTQGEGSGSLWRNASIFPTVTLVENSQNGDFDGDGDVDGADFLKWQRELGGDATKLGLWQDNFGTPAAAPATAPVPEPACGTLLLTATCGLFLRWRRRN